MKILFPLALLFCMAFQAAAVQPQFEGYTPGVPRVALGIYVPDEFNDVNGNGEFDWEDSQAVGLYVLYTWPGEWNLLTTENMQKGKTIGDLIDIASKKYPRYVGDINRYSWELGYSDNNLVWLEKSIILASIDDEDRNGLMDEYILDSYQLADWSGYWLALHNSGSIQKAQTVKPSPVPSSSPSRNVATVTIQSPQYKNYQVTVDGVVIGKEGEGQDPLDGKITFVVAGNQRHSIAVNHPMNWMTLTEFFGTGESYSFRFPRY